MNGPTRSTRCSGLLFVSVASGDQAQQARRRVALDEQTVEPVGTPCRREEDPETDDEQHVVVAKRILTASTRYDDVDERLDDGEGATQARELPKQEG